MECLDEGKWVILKNQKEKVMPSALSKQEQDGEDE